MAKKRRKTKAELPPPTWANPDEPGDRRSARRIDKEVRVKLIADGSTHLEATLRSSDMSLSGIFLRSTFFLPEGCHVQLAINQEGTVSAIFTGVVVRIVREGDNPGLGIHFIDIDEEQLATMVTLFAGDAITEFVERVATTKRPAEQRAIANYILRWETERLAH